MATLYRDYRPQNFSEILGQNHLKITLQNELATDKVAQAYLFCGPRAVGKTTLARVLAKAVNCERRKPGEFEPCNKCGSCESITVGRNLDVVEIDAASNTGVDNVRENIIAFSRLAPTGGKYKVFIIDEVHMLSLSAFNALLKIIEEPPAFVMFILCTTEVHKVPLTIISRCERFDFKKISVAEIVKKLSLISRQEKVEVDKEILEAVARRSGGHLRDAESLLGQIFSLGDKKITLAEAELVIPHYNSHEAVDLLSHLAAKDAAQAVILINGLADSGVNLKNFTAEIIGLLRQITLNKLSPGLAASVGLDLGENLEIRLGQVTAELSWDRIFAFTQRFLAAYNDNKNLLIPQLPLEMAVAELCLGSSSGQKTETSDINPPLAPNWPSAPTLKKDWPPVREAKAGGVASSVPPLKSSTPPDNRELNLKAAAVKEKWPEFLVKLKKYNHSLSFVMQNCEPGGIKNNELSLTFKYKFHQDRIKDAVIKDIVARTLAEVFNAPLDVFSQVDEDLVIRREEPAASAPALKEATAPVAEPVKNSNPLGDVLKVFGGEVIS